MLVHFNVVNINSLFSFINSMDKLFLPHLELPLIRNCIKFFFPTSTSGSSCKEIVGKLSLKPSSILSGVITTQSQRFYFWNY